MTIILTDSSTAGVLEDYDDLLAALPLWSNRTDLAAMLPQFVRMFEARANRLLRIKDMEAAFPLTALSDGAAVLPSNFLAFKELRNVGANQYTLEPRPIEWLRKQPTVAIEPMFFSVMDGQVVCWPTAGSIEGTYYAALPSLVSEGANWLLTAHPDFYLFGTLEQMGIYLRDPNLIEMAGGRAATMLEEIKGASLSDSFNGGPLQVRPGVAVR